MSDEILNESANKFSWKKFFTGIVNPVNFAKAISQIAWISIVCIVAIGLWWFAKSTVLKPKPIQQPVTIKTSEGNVQLNQGEVKKNRFSILSLFSW